MELAFQMDRKHTQKKFVILGGGVAGLAAANRLVDHGIEPLLIEAGEYPRHRVCGEFFSGEITSYFKKWKISGESTISHIQFGRDPQHLFTLPVSASALSHYSFDTQLVKRIENKGGIIKTGSVVKELIVDHERGGGRLILAGGEEIIASHLFIGAGRWTNQEFRPKYLGIKAHFQGDHIPNTLAMHVFKGGYMGMVPIEEGKVNIAAIIDKKIIQEQAEELFMEQFAFMFPKNRLFKWMSVPIPEFGPKRVPSWKNCFFIGDTIGSIPPFSGYGLTMAIEGGVLAADVSLTGDEKEYMAKWRKRYLAPIRWGKLFHRAALQAEFFNPLIRRFPRLIPWGYNRIR